MRTLPSVAVTFQQDAKDFQTANHVLNYYAPSREFPIGSLLVFRESAFLRLLLWRPDLVMQFVQALIAAVSEQFKGLVRLKSALFVKSEIMHGAAAMCREDDLSGAPVDHDL
jgi:hypothetical protein